MHKLLGHFIMIGGAPWSYNGESVFVPPGTQIYRVPDNIYWNIHIKSLNWPLFQSISYHALIVQNNGISLNLIWTNFTKKNRTYVRLKI